MFHLEVSALTAQAGEFRLGPVELQLPAGAYLVIMGPSGCGKSTLLRTMAGLEPAASGSIRLGGEDVTRQPPQRRGAGWVPQDAGLFPHLDVRRNVTFGLRYLNLPAAEAAARLDEAVTVTGIAGLLTRQPATLSGGEARRVALARALILKPRLLLLDEPLGMLDAPARTALLAALDRLRRGWTGVTLHVTHLEEEARLLPDARRASMTAGKLEMKSLKNEV